MTATNASPYRLYLRENQIPTAWYNLRADMPGKAGTHALAQWQNCHTRGFSTGVCRCSCRPGT